MNLISTRQRLGKYQYCTYFVQTSVPVKRILLKCDWMSQCKANLLKGWPEIVTFFLGWKLSHPKLGLKWYFLWSTCNLNWIEFTLPKIRFGSMISLHVFDIASVKMNVYWVLCSFASPLALAINIKSVIFQ